MQLVENVSHGMMFGISLHLTVSFGKCRAKSTSMYTYICRTRSMYILM